MKLRHKLLIAKFLPSWPACSVWAGIMAEISAAASEQRSGINQVNGTVSDLDRMPQRNAALVEQSAAATDSLRALAGALTKVPAGLALGAQRRPGPA